MAISGRSRSMMMTFCNMGAILVTLVGAGVVVQAHLVNEEGCPEEDYAYPFQSVCQAPATFDTEYHLVAPFSNAAVAKGGLTPDSQSLVRFTGNASDEGAKYVLTPVSTEGDTVNITLGTAFTVTNSETNMVLGWRFMAWQRGNLLAELEDSTDAAQFVLQTACNVPLPCPETTGARCESYFFLSGTTGFLSTNYFNLGKTYVAPDTEGAVGNLPLLLRRVSTDSDLKLRQVVAH